MSFFDDIPYKCNGEKYIFEHIKETLIVYDKLNNEVILMLSEYDLNDIIEFLKVVGGE